MALWKDPSSTPSPTASGTPASGTPTTVTELHKGSEHTTSDTARRAGPARAAGVESIIAAEITIEGGWKARYAPAWWWSAASCRGTSRPPSRLTC